ncbi:MAG: thiamine diphosphokinase [Peptococcaceae bacterium]|nr:thiamine diphosphokinase [Peptococcaceae bacterium]
MRTYTADLTSLGARHAILVTGGVAPDPALLAKARADYPDALCYCADGGADLCMRAHVVPDLLLGDMDSLSAAARNWITAAGVPQEIFPPEKNDTDTALAVDKLFAAGAEEIIVIGALGGRMDHELTNVMELVTSGRQGRSLVFWDDTNRLRYIGPGTHALHKCAGYIGMIPFADSGMTLSIEGLYYTLDHYTVPFGASRLTSNEFADASEAHIDIHAGDGVLVICRDKNALAK